MLLAQDTSQPIFPSIIQTYNGSSRFEDSIQPDKLTSWEQPIRELTNSRLGNSLRELTNSRFENSLREPTSASIASMVTMAGSYAGLFSTGNRRREASSTQAQENVTTVENESRSSATTWEQPI